MTRPTKILPLPFVFFLVLATPAFAQSADESQASGANEESGENSGALALSMGLEDDGELTIGTIYLEDAYGDWELRCIKSEESADPCQLYQLIDDDQGNPMAEISIFTVEHEKPAVAGATVVTPLETLLTQRLSMSIDEGEVRRYPFSWCSQIGCFSRIGLVQEDIEAFRNGSEATFMVVPAAAPDQRVNLPVSLNGFAAGYAALEAR